MTVLLLGPAGPSRAADVLRRSLISAGSTRNIAGPASGRRAGCIFFLLRLEEAQLDDGPLQLRPAMKDLDGADDAVRAGMDLRDAAEGPLTARGARINDEDDVADDEAALRQEPLAALG